MKNFEIKRNQLKELIELVDKIEQAKYEMENLYKNSDIEIADDAYYHYVELVNEYNSNFHSYSLLRL